MTEQLALQNKLREYLLEVQRKNPSFSLRALAKRIQLSPSAVSEILNGKRKVSQEMAEKILKNIGCDLQEQYRLLSLFNTDMQQKSFIEDNYLKLTADQFRLIADWYHFAILSLAETEDFRADPLWIAKRLGINLPVAEMALERLERLGLIEWSRGRRILKLTQSQVSTPDEVSAQALQKSHHADLELSKQAIEQVDLALRDFTSMTLAIDVKKLPQAKKMIREFHAKMSAYLESGVKNEVYKLCIHMMPISKTLPKSFAETMSNSTLKTTVKK